MNNDNDNLSGVDERTERLICRLLDEEITPDERAELDAVLADDPAARLLLDEYAQNDALSAQALRRDFDHAFSAPVRHRRSSLWVASAGALLAAAAVVAFSLLPEFWSNGQASPTGFENKYANAGLPKATQPAVPASASPDAYQWGDPQLVGYRNNLDYMPRRRQRDLEREWIAIPTTREGVILIIERNKQTTTVTPISGDF
jgi:hypothetical protein